MNKDKLLNKLDDEMIIINYDIDIVLSIAKEIGIDVIVQEYNDWISYRLLDDDPYDAIYRIAKLSQIIINHLLEEREK